MQPNPDDDLTNEALRTKLIRISFSYAGILAGGIFPQGVIEGDSWDPVEWEVFCELCERGLPEFDVRSAITMLDLELAHVKAAVLQAALPVADGEAIPRAPTASVPSQLSRKKERKPRRRETPLTAKQLKILEVVAQHQGDTVAAATEPGCTRQNVSKTCEIAKKKLATPFGNQKKNVAIDPTTLDAGERQDGRTKRQRERYSDE